MITTDDKKFVFVADETDKEIAADKVVVELMTKELVSITGATPYRENPNGPYSIIDA